ncbi:hypothetical protein [Brachyspira sp.]|uniref:hypothetical protein n=1 Tax=Brachyspira sp. TaxID=1977261 RepID=UPI00260C3AEF|nr:hypothetical protein [Brachyspira sp.]
MANTKYSKVAAMMFFPVLALMGQSHFAVYYGIVPTVILYLIVRYKISIKYIKYIFLGVFFSFLTYLPYLISEIQNGFLNTNKMFMLSSTAERNVFPFPQVHFLFTFPTNEFSVMYDAKHLNRIMAFYLNDNPYYIFSLIVLVLSIIVVFGAFIYSIIYFIKNKKWKIYNNTNNTEMVINELFILFLLYFPATIFTTIFGGGVAGLARYQFGGFALSFIPIIYLLYYLTVKNNYRVLNYIAVFSILSAIAMNFNIMVYYQKFHEPYRWTDYIDAVYSIIKDSNGMNFSVDNASSYFNDMGKAYSKNDGWKNVDSNYSITYYLDVPEFGIKYPPIYDRNALLSKKYTKEEIEDMKFKNSVKQ